MNTKPKCVMVGDYPNMVPVNLKLYNEKEGADKENYLLEHAKAWEQAKLNGTENRFIYEMEMRLSQLTGWPMQ